MPKFFKPIAAAMLAVSLLGISTVFAQTGPDTEPSQGTTMTPDMMQDGNMMGMMGMMSQMTEMMATCNQMMQAMAPQQMPDAPQQPDSNGG